jgi:hypothetical protein
MQTKYITIKTGYGAETALGNLIFNTGTPYETPQAALESLALDLFEKFLRESYPENACCAKRKKGWKACPKCGCVFDNPLPDVDDFTDWLRRDFNFRIIDRYGEEMKNWDPFYSVEVLIEAPRGSVLCVSIYGENVVAAALDLSKVNHPLAKRLAREDSAWACSLPSLFIPEEYRYLIPSHKLFD